MRTPLRTSGSKRKSCGSPPTTAKLSTLTAAPNTVPRRMIAWAASTQFAPISTPSSTMA
jgi:hypothetical protein